MTEDEPDERDTDVHETADQRDRTRRRRLSRSRDDRVIAGVCGGLGDYFSIDPVVFRVGFVAFTLVGGSGLVLYLIGWLVIPSQGHRRSVGEAALHRRPSSTTVGMALLLLAVILLADIGPWHRHRLGLPFLLLAAGAVLLFVSLQRSDGEEAPSDDRPTSAERPSPPPPPPSSPDPETTSSATPAGSSATPESSPPPPLVPPGPSGSSAAGPRRRWRRPRSHLTRITLSILLLAAGTAGLLEAADVVDVTVEGFLAAALVLTGIGLLVGTWWGRSRALIALGIVLVVVLGVARSVDVPLAGGFGERSYDPVALTDVRERYRLFAGEMSLDLSELDLDGRSLSVRAQVTFGKLTVVTPADARTVVVARVGAGEATVFGETDDGVSVRERVTVPGEHGTLRLRLEVGAGEIDVRRGVPREVG